MARILAYTSPSTGHLFPLVPGRLALQQRGHDVDLRIGERLLGVARDGGLNAQPSDPAIAAIEIKDSAAGKDTEKLRLADAVEELVPRDTAENMMVHAAEPHGGPA